MSVKSGKILSDFQRMCAIVDRGMAAWVEVGIALARIRDERMYKQTHKTFEEFVAERFDLTRRRAYQMISEAEVAKEHKLESGAQARALAKVAPDMRDEVLEAARGGGTLTAKSITVAAGTGLAESWTLVAISERIEAASKDLLALRDTPAAAWLPVDRILTVLGRAIAMIDAAVPDTQCSRCEGRGCIDCRETGWIPSRLNAEEPE